MHIYSGICPNAGSRSIRQNYNRRHERDRKITGKTQKIRNVKSKEKSRYLEQKNVANDE